MPDRIPCINLKCRRTFANKEGWGEVVCNRCLRAVPDRMRLRFKQTKRRERKLRRLWPKLYEARSQQLGRTWNANLRALNIVWNQMKAYFNAPQHPEGLEKFLEEVGL